MMLKELKKNYTRRINRRYSNNKQLLIDSFTEYYGEQYRSKIENRVNNTIISYYIPSDMISNFEIIINDYLENIFDINAHIINQLQIEDFDANSISCEIDSYEISKKHINFNYCVRDDRTKEILKLVFGDQMIISLPLNDMPIMNYLKLSNIEKQKYIKSLYKKQCNDDNILKTVEEINKNANRINYLEKSVKKCYELNLFADIYIKEKNSSIDVNFVGSNNGSFVRNNLLIFLSLFTNESNAFCKSCYNYVTNDVVNFIFLPIFSCGDIFLIHELNHAVTSDVLLLTNEDEIIRNGLIVENDDESANEYLEELVNEFTSSKILNIFKSKGGNILDNEQLFSATIPYEDGLYIIDDIIIKIEEELKHIRMNGDINKLKYFLGNENYFKLSKYCDKILKRYIIPEKKYKKNLSYIKKFVKYLKTDDYLIDDDLEEYILKLKNVGYNVNLTESGKQLINKKSL